MVRGLGYRPDSEHPDERDRRFSAHRAAHVARAVESRFDDLVHGIRDQDTSSSCVGHGARGGLELRRAIDGKPHVDLSALGVYWPARAVNGYQNEDGGALVRSAMKILHGVGAPSEAAWPFSMSRVNTRPSTEAEVDGLVRADGTYERITETGAARVEAVLDALQARCPVVFGTLVTERFMDWRGSDTIPAPSATDVIVGGHCTYLAGFDRSGERLRLVNSWGVGFADRGMAWIAAEWMSYVGTEDVWVMRPNTAEALHA